MKFSERLEKALKERGLSQTYLAARLGVSAPTINQYVSGKREPDFDQLEKIARALNVSPSWLIGLDAEHKAMDRIGAASVIASALSENEDEGQKLFEELEKRWGAAARSVSDARKILDNADDNIAQALRIINSRKKKKPNSKPTSRAAIAAAKVAEELRKPKG